MREYYGELSNCFEYIEDKNHKAIPWKDYEFSFKFHNNTKYILELKRGKSCHIFATVKPKEKIEIQVNKWGDGEIFVQAKEVTDLKCNFKIERGCMIKRNLVKHVKDKVYIAPIFKSGIVTIVTCDNCGPDLGEKKQYKISPLKKTDKTIKVCNYTPYDIIISTENTVIQRIEANKKNGKKCPSKLVGIPSNGVIYVDTVSEEIAWKDDYRVFEDAILRVNGCCIKINDGSCFECVSIIGPALSEPYIHHLYASFNKILKDEGDINIWCNTIDYRLD